MPTKRQSDQADDHDPSGRWFVKAELAPAAAVTKYRWLHGVGLKHGFVAPDAKLTADGAGVAVVFIDGFVPLRTSYISYLSGSGDRAAILDLFRRVGSVLGQIHNEALPSNFAALGLDADLRKLIQAYGLDTIPAEAPVPLHCDFGLLNLGTSPSGEIVVLDPCANVLTQVETHLVAGSPYLDLGKMLAALEGQLPATEFFMASQKRVCAAQAAFLQGYATRRPGVDVRTAFAYAAAMYHRRTRTVGGIRRVAWSMMYSPLRGNGTLRDKMAQFERHSR